LAPRVAPTILVTTANRCDGSSGEPTSISAKPRATASCPAIELDPAHPRHPARSARPRSPHTRCTAMPSTSPRRSASAGTACWRQSWCLSETTWSRTSSRATSDSASHQGPPA
jgi:hypothetical protein